MTFDDPLKYFPFYFGLLGAILIGLDVLLPMRQRMEHRHWVGPVSAWVLATVFCFFYLRVLSEHAWAATAADVNGYYIASIRDRLTWYDGIAFSLAFLQTPVTLAFAIVGYRKTRSERLGWIAFGFGFVLCAWIAIFWIGIASLPEPKG